MWVIEVIQLFPKRGKFKNQFYIYKSMNILGILELDERNRVYFPSIVFDILNKPEHLKIVEKIIDGKNQIVIESENYDGKALAKINVNANMRRGTIPKKVREKLSLNAHNPFIILLKNDRNEIMMKRLDVEKIIGDD